METVLIFGATGDQGWPLMRQLQAAGYKVRAATRDPAAFDWSPYPGVEPVAADISDQASLNAAAKGASGTVMHLPFTFDRSFARHMGSAIAEAARQAGHSKIVFHTSCVVADHDLGIDGHDGRRDIEAAIEASGVPFVFVRSAVFMDNMVRDWARPSITKHGLFAYPAAPTLKVSWISHEDVAAYMIAAYADETLTAERFYVGGPEALTGDEVAERLSKALGRTIRFHSLHPDEFARGISKLVTGKDDFEPGSIYDRMAEFYRWYNAQPVSPLDVDLRPVLKVLPVRPTPLLVWAGQQNWS